MSLKTWTGERLLRKTRHHRSVLATQPWMRLSASSSWWKKSQRSEMKLTQSSCQKITNLSSRLSNSKPSRCTWRTKERSNTKPTWRILTTLASPTLQLTQDEIHLVPHRNKEHRSTQPTQTLQCRPLSKATILEASVKTQRIKGTVPKVSLAGAASLKTRTRR